MGFDENFHRPASAGLGGDDYPMKARATGRRIGVTKMIELFRDFWWLIFPVGFLIAGGFNSLLNYKRQQDALKLIRTYAEKGQEPPAALLKILERPIDEDGDWGKGAGKASNDGSWFSVVLFGVMAVGFGYGASTDMYGARDALVIVTFVLAGLCLACLVSALRAGRRPRN